MSKSRRIWLAGLALLLLPQQAARQDGPHPPPPRTVAGQTAEPPQPVAPPQARPALPPPLPGPGGPETAPAPVQPVEPPAPPEMRPADFGAEQPSPDARHIADWALNSGDPGGRPFAIVDKVEARVYVFDPGGRLQGAAPALLGLAPGDDSVPGIGERPIAAIRPHERTTPAGRFVAEPGLNTSGEDIVWVDYDNAISMHRVRPVDPREKRLERLASPSPEDNRISYGCINLPPDFYDGVLSPLIGTRRGVVYVLPETLPLQAVFDTGTLVEAPDRLESSRRPDPAEEEAFWRAVMAR